MWLTMSHTASIPAGSEISRRLAGAHFHDCFELPVPPGGPSALALYLDLLSRTPHWVNTLMAVRNRVVARLGLKNLGALGQVDPDKPAQAYRVGDRVGIFSLLYLSDDEVILGDSDKHLDVQVSVCRHAEGGRPRVAATTVVWIHNTLGRLYMGAVVPVHKLIVPAMLRRL